MVPPINFVILGTYPCVCTCTYRFTPPLLNTPEFTRWSCIIFILLLGIIFVQTALYISVKLSLNFRPQSSVAACWTGGRPNIQSAGRQNFLPRILLTSVCSIVSWIEERFASKKSEMWRSQLVWCSFLFSLLKWN